MNCGDEYVLPSCGTSCDQYASSEAAAPFIRQSTLAFASAPVLQSTSSSPVPTCSVLPPAAPPTSPVTSTPSSCETRNTTTAPRPTPPAAIPVVRPRRRTLPPLISAFGSNVMPHTVRRAAGPSRGLRPSQQFLSFSSNPRGIGLKSQDLFARV